MSRRKYNHRRSLIADLLPNIVRQKGWEVQVDLHSIFEDWRHIVGHDADYATPEVIVKNVLFVRVENSAWMQQFQYRKMELLDSLNDHLRLSRLTDIKFKLAAKKKRHKKAKKAAVRFEPPSGQEQEDFRKQIEIITNEKVRESLMRLWYLSHSCKRGSK